MKKEKPGGPALKFIYQKTISRMINTIIIDDETGIRNVIKSLLERFCPNINLIGQADSVESGLELIIKTHPDLVFLDVEMPGGSGFDILDGLSNYNFQTIFVTAYDKYAIQAIKFSALDYILKPINSKELVESVKKMEYKINDDQNIRSLLQNLKSPDGFKKIAIPSVGKIRYLDIKKIVRCESEGSYTHLYMDLVDRIVSTRPILEYESLLGDKGFFRIHRSHLINLAMVKEYQKKERDVVYLKDGSVVEVSRKKRTRFLEAMSNFVN